MSVITSYKLKKEGLKKFLEEKGIVHADDLWNGRRKEYEHFDCVFDVKAASAEASEELVLTDMKVFKITREEAESAQKWPVWFYDDDTMGWQINYGDYDFPAYALGVAFPDMIFCYHERYEGDSRPYVCYFKGTRFDEDKKFNVFNLTDANGKAVNSTMLLTGAKSEESNDGARTVSAIAAFEDFPKHVWLTMTFPKEDVMDYDGSLLVFLRNDEKIAVKCSEGYRHEPMTGGEILRAQHDIYSLPDAETLEERQKMIESGEGCYEFITL